MLNYAFFYEKWSRVNWALIRAPMVDARDVIEGLCQQKEQTVLSSALHPTSHSIVDGSEDTKRKNV